MYTLYKMAERNTQNFMNSTAISISLNDFAKSILGDNYIVYYDIKYNRFTFIYENNNYVKKT